MTQELREPRSFSAFRDERRDLDEKAALEEFGRTLDMYRQSVAAEIGVHPDKLHFLGPETIRQELAVRAIIRSINQPTEGTTEAMPAQ